MSTTDTTYGYSRRHRAVEIVSIAAVFGLLIGFGVRVGRTVDTPGGWVGMALTLLVSYVASDMISGVVHWAGDTIGHERVPFVGPNFIRPFREHHVDQRDITTHDFIETNGNNCIVVLTPLLLAFLLSPRAGFGFFVATFVAFLGLFVVATNQFHKWAHEESPPWPARPLQRWGLILSPRHHEIHHAAPHDKHYCITVGWMNPVLNGLRFFRALEWLIARVRPTWLHIEERTRFAATRAAVAAQNVATAPLPEGSPAP
ncbi:MAG TPA: fatty acid desaturase CarF family protein [Polyangia bacterium]